MNAPWLQEYALLALRVDKIMRSLTELPYVDGYYGPAEWKAKRLLREQVLPSELAR